MRFLCAMTNLKRLFLSKLSKDPEDPFWITKQKKEMVKKKKKQALAHLQTPQNLKNARRCGKALMNCLNLLFFLANS